MPVGVQQPVARLQAAGHPAACLWPPQESCCNKAYKHPKAGQPQFDLSFWAYEQLAHPMYPEMMLEYRPVGRGPACSSAGRWGAVAPRPLRGGVVCPGRQLAGMQD